MDQDTVDYIIGPGDTVRLLREALEPERTGDSDVRDFLSGATTWFPPFVAPTYPGEQGWVKVGEDRYENRGFYGGAHEARLIDLAYCVRRFAWNQDQRTDRLMNLVNGAVSPGGQQLIEEASTQDLWDALFVFARGDRFSDGLLASSATELTTVANEIRRRLLGGAARDLR